MSSLSLEGKHVCIMGAFGGMTRAEAAQFAKDHGATKVTNAVSGKTELLVAASVVAKSKLRDAKKKGVEIWTEEQFRLAVGVEEKEGSEEEEDKDGDKKMGAVEEGDEEKKDDEVPTKPKRGKKRKATKEDPEPKNDAKPKKSAKATAAAKKKKANDGSDEEEKKPPAAKKGKKTPAAAAAKKAPPAPAKKPAAAAAAPRARRVMPAIGHGESSYVVHGDYDAKLMQSDSLNANSNKFYKIQLLQQKAAPTVFYVATNWGRLGEPGKSQLKGPHNEENGIKAFCKVFKSKTLNDWGTTNFIKHGHKYQLVETADDGGDGDAVLGRLTEAQIHKGQTVLKQIRTILEGGAVAKDGTRKPLTSKQKGDLGYLSNDFYSLIPTTSGRQRPPKLDNLDILTEKEGLLEFWLRMGFDDVAEVKLDGSPIEGCFELPVPSTLFLAANNITDNHSISSSQSRAAGLAKSQAGDPVKKMGKELYAAILLYTGNSIYRELNRVLRTEWKSVPKYWKYLRLYFEATDHMPTREATLWRGIAADLYDEYEEGKVITWWTVSSCTADENVARNFMSQLGGNATLLTLHTKRACDISSLSFYPHERESLLRPGTKLRVLKRKRNGKVAEIEVEEVLE